MTKVLTNYTALLKLQKNHNIKVEIYYDDIKSIKNIKQKNKIANTHQKST